MSNFLDCFIHIFGYAILGMSPLLLIILLICIDDFHHVREAKRANKAMKERPVSPCIYTMACQIAVECAKQNNRNE